MNFWFLIIIVIYTGNVTLTFHEYKSGQINGKGALFSIAIVASVIFVIYKAIKTGF